MKRIACYAASVIVLTLMLAVISSAQGTLPPVVGTPAFGSFSGGPDIINNGNLNISLTIPVRHKAGRGADASIDLTYDSSVWYPVGATGSKVWTRIPNPVVPGWQGLGTAGNSYIGYSMAYTNTQCTNNGSSWYPFQVWAYNSFYYVDTVGMRHNYNANWSYVSNSYSQFCGPQPGYSPGPATQSQSAFDDSGYVLNVVPNFNANISAWIVDKGGTVINAPVIANPVVTPKSVYDLNGNQITTTNGVVTDTLGQTDLTPFFVQFGV